MSKKQTKLKTKIETLRTGLRLLAETIGKEDPQVLEKSQQLDQCIVSYMESQQRTRKKA